MVPKIKLFLFIILIISSLHTAKGEDVKTSDLDSVKLSLLTCAPGDAIYTLFGHTAIRYENPAKKIDVIFNYGLFNFNKPNFIWRFSLGETDYELGIPNSSHTCIRPCPVVKSNLLVYEISEIVSHAAILA